MIKKVIRLPKDGIKAIADGLDNIERLTGTRPNAIALQCNGKPRRYKLKYVRFEEI